MVNAFEIISHPRGLRKGVDILFKDRKNKIKICKISMSF